MLVIGVHDRGGDTGRYLKGAANLINGDPMSGKQASYLAYIAIVAIFKFLQTDLIYLVLFQCMVAGFAALAIFELGRAAGGNLAGLIAGAFFVANPEIAKWHAYVMTDSLYMSFVCLTTWFLYAATKINKAYSVPAILSLLVTVFLRPNGWLFVLIVPIYLVVQLNMGLQKKVLLGMAIAVIFAAGAALIPAFRDAVQNEYPDEMLKRGTLIWGYFEWKLSMPADQVAGQGWLTGVAYGIAHPVSSLKLAVLRILIEIMHVRPYFSLPHNIFIVLYFLTMYLFAARSLSKSLVPRDLLRLLVLVAISHLALIGLTFANWDGRFLLYFLFTVNVLAACSISEIVLPGTSIDKAHSPA